MKNRSKEIAIVASGIVLGAAIAGPAATATLTAQQSSQKIFVDGQQAQIEAYSINGSNYCKLRDIGKAIGFSVSYDPLTNSVQISTESKYKEDNTLGKLRTVSLPKDGSQYIPQITDAVHTVPNVRYYVDAYDYYHNNVYQYTRYLLLTL